MDFERLNEKLHLIDREIGHVFPKEGVPNLNDAVYYHMETGGKKLRPLLAMATCEVLGGSADEIAPFAAACEVLHNWFLVHDDIEDGDKVRRDKPATWVKFGLAHGINVGDYMAQKVYELVLKTKEKNVSESKVLALIDSMITTSIKTAEGQAMDINLRNNDSPTEKDYLDMVMGKTGHYLTVTMVGAAIVTGRNDLIPKLVEFGHSIGPAFQITDDVLDLTAGKGRGEIGRDIKEGKRSIMAIHCLHKCSHDEKRKLLSILNKSPEGTSDEDVLFAKELFEKYGSIEYATNRADEMEKAAKKIADKIPELRELLYYFADKLVHRKN